MKDIRPVVYTVTAKCKDCYRCLRVCPVKAIRLKQGQASVDEDRCIACGTCIRECPQGVKMFRDDVDVVQRLLDAGEVLAASVAPSFAAYFEPWQRKRFVSALRRLGFRYVGETASAAWTVAAESAHAAAKAGGTAFCTACPAVVSLVERYYPNKTSRLVPVASPMIAHARQIQEALGKKTKVVFIGPCVAKKKEAQRPGYEDTVAAALTFSEALRWFEGKGIHLDACEESDFDDTPAGAAPYFPLPGGLAKTAALSDSSLNDKVLFVHGIDEVREALEFSAAGGTSCLVEPLFCRNGCINGPGMGVQKNSFERRARVLGYAAAHRTIAEPECTGDAGAEYCPAPQAQRNFSEEEIQNILRRTGKISAEQQLNCGACGYGSCREKAIAVLEGMAEPEMCLPYMRRLAEGKTDRIMETSPNGIVILDDKLRITSMNPAFKQLFTCTDAVLGKRISYLIDPEPFERLSTGAVDNLDTEQRYDAYGIVCRQYVYALREEQQYVGLFVNITKGEDDRRQLEQLKQESVQRARELLKQQIGMAQQIAQFLGESTARSEEIVREISKLTDKSNENR